MYDEFKRSIMLEYVHCTVYTKYEGCRQQILRIPAAFVGKCHIFLMKASYISCIYHNMMLYVNLFSLRYQLNSVLHTYINRK